MSSKNSIKNKVTKLFMLTLRCFGMMLFWIEFSNHGRIDLCTSPTTYCNRLYVKNKL